MHSRLIDGRFPNYEQIIPQHMDCIAECEVPNLKRALDGIKVVAVESSSITRFTVNGHIDVKAENENASLERAVPAQTTNDEGQVSQIIFNYTLMLAFLAAHPQGKLQLELMGPTKPGKVLFPDTPGFVGVIMPMHINR
jgi:DNA polymerase-3 subunit beta